MTPEDRILFKEALEKLRLLSDNLTNLKADVHYVLTGLEFLLKDDEKNAIQNTQLNQNMETSTSLRGVQENGVQNNATSFKITPLGIANLPKEEKPKAEHKKPTAIIGPSLSKEEAKRLLELINKNGM